jgi:hypothetical protein
MIILGIILLIAGFLLKISMLWTIGIILVVIGAILAIVGSTGALSAGAATGFESWIDGPALPLDAQTSWHLLGARGASSALPVRYQRICWFG